MENLIDSEWERDKYIIGHYWLLYWLRIPQRSAWI